MSLKKYRTGNGRGTLASSYPRCLPATTRQQQVLHAIRMCAGAPPTIRELMTALDISSPSAVAGHLKALRRKGLVTWEANRARTLRLVEKGIPLMGIVT